MKTKNFSRPALLAMGLLVLQSGQAQVSVGQNNPLAPGSNYVGWDNNTTVPLQIRHENNQQIQFFTNNIRRMQLLPSDTYTIGGFTGQTKSGSLVLARDVAAFYGGGAPGPYTRLHLADTPNGTQQSGYRSNMQNGVTMTGNNDQMYVGQLYHGLDYTDAAILWSDNPGGWLADRLTFNFTSSYNSSATRGSNTFRGLQTLLVQPAESGDEAYVGVGDFDADGATPNERLHVHGGTIRVDSLIPDYRNDTLSRVVMSDGLGRMHWRHISTWPSTGTADCKWTLLGAGNASIATAYAGDPGCPQADRKVGIGTDSPQYKLSVFHSEASSTAPGGLSVDLVAEPIGWAHGIQSSVEPLNGSVEFAAGVQGRVIAVDSIGIAVHGIASALALDGFFA